jgi:hypothetical protein
MLQINRILSGLLREFQEIYARMDRHKQKWISNWRPLSHTKNIDRIEQLMGPMEYWKDELFKATPWIRLVLDEQAKKHADTSQIAESS